MNKILSSAVLVAAGVIASPLAANAYTFDGFGDVQRNGASIFFSDADVTLNTWVSGGQVAVTDTDVNNLFRTIEADLTGGPPDEGTTGVAVTVAVDGNGRYRHRQDPEMFGQSRATWCVKADCSGTDDLSAWENLKLQITVLSQDQIDAPKDPQLTFTMFDSDGDSITHTFSLDQKVTPPATLTYSQAFSGFTETGTFDWNKFQKAVMLVNGNETADLDLVLDIIGSVPEPTSLGLLGLGLLGMGTIRRRRV